MEIEILNLTLVETNGSTFRVSGNASDIETFSQWLNEFFFGLITGENRIDEILEKKTEKVAYSMLYHIKIDEIMVKATELEVACLLSHNQDQMSLTGLPKNLESFKAYLRKINPQAKKYLFPSIGILVLLNRMQKFGLVLDQKRFRRYQRYLIMASRMLRLVA